jgi:4'-phosphopantetheinyl transferase
VAVAVSNAGAVGVDVQQVQDDSVHELSSLVLAESEAGHVALARDFFTYWTRKEALVKATGDGVAVPLSEVVVTPPGTPPGLLGYPGQGGLTAQLRDLSPAPGYVGALAVLTLGRSSPRSDRPSSCWPGDPQRSPASARSTW